jgi:hypothetical protein
MREGEFFMDSQMMWPYECMITVYSFVEINMGVKKKGTVNTEVPFFLTRKCSPNNPLFASFIANILYQIWKYLFFKLVNGI